MKGTKCLAFTGERGTAPRVWEARLPLQGARGSGGPRPDLCWPRPVYSAGGLWAGEGAKGREPGSADSLLRGSTSWRRGTLHRNSSR